MLFLSINGYNSKQTRGLLTSAAHVHLRLSDFSKHTQKLMPAGRAILLSGPAGMLSGICDLIWIFMLLSPFNWPNLVAFCFIFILVYLLKNFISEHSPKL